MPSDDGRSVTLSLGGGDLRVPLPSGWEVSQVVEPADPPPLGDLGAALAAALARPIGCAPLQGRDLAGRRVVIAIDDVSRPTPIHLLFPRVLDAVLGAGADLRDVLVLGALGVHRPMTPSEVAMRLGGGLREGLRYENHDSRDPGRLVDLGTTTRGTPVRLNHRLAEADLIVCIGAVEPHLLLGFGGGLKMICPGLAGEETIARNHMQGVSPEKYNYVGALESPMRLDLEEAALKLGKEFFVLNAVLDRHLSPCFLACGHPIMAQREGARRAQEFARCRVPGPADVAIVSSDPMNADLRQGMKCVGNVEQSVRDGGLVLAFLGCRNGVGDVSLPPRSLPNRLLRVLLRAIGPKRILPFVDLVKKGAGTEERFLAHFSLQVARKLRILVHSPGLPEGVGRRMGIFRQFESVETMMREAARLAPRRPIIHLHPYGGATYPVIEA